MSEYIIIDADSSNIEARGLAWLAEQNDLVDDFANNVDVYAKIASVIYGKIVTKETFPLERFVGKTVTLGCGYQTGKDKLQATLKSGDPSIALPIEECATIINTYRTTYARIPLLWKQGEKALQAIHDNQSMWLGREGVLWVDGKKGILLPSGLYLTYNQLHKETVEGKTRWVYKSEYGFNQIYGGKVIENVTQALARIIIGKQMLNIAKTYKVAMTVHDSVVSVVKKAELEAAKAHITSRMREAPKWATGWPLNCELAIGETYGG